MEETYQEEMVEELRKHACLELKRWWGNFNYGFEGTIVTEEKEIYQYEYNQPSSRTRKEDLNYLKKVGNLSEEQWEKIKKYIKKQQRWKKIFRNSISLCDEGYDVSIYIEDQEITFKDEEYIYNEIKEIIENE